MAWIESHQAVGHHPKTIRFAELLHVNLATAVGHLHYFWWWALDFAPSGDIRTTPGVLARACEWKGNPERFVQALVTAGFLEDRGEEGIAIHDWLDYAGRLVEKRAANRERQRRHRNGENGVTSRVTNASVTGLPTVPTNQPTGGSYLASATNQPTVADQPTPQSPPSDQPKGGVCCPFGKITNGEQHSEFCAKTVPA